MTEKTSVPWQFKCAFDTVKAALPFQNSLRQLKDRMVGYQREKNRETRTIRDGITMIEWLGTVADSTVLEIGSGWQPLLPIVFSLAGARVITADLHRLIRLDTFSATLDSIRENQDEIVGHFGITRETVDHVTSECRNVEERLKELRITYLSPCDCRQMPLDAGSVDLVTSRAALEHIPPAVIFGIFRDSHRVLRPGGRMLHLVDHSDHWSHRDSGINAVNFLQYPDWLFSLTCLHPQNYQNRLRHPEYVAMLESAGFALIREEKTVNPNCVTALSEMRVSEKFSRFSPQDLATTSSYLLAAKSKASAVH